VVSVVSVAVVSDEPESSSEHAVANNEIATTIAVPARMLRRRRIEPPGLIVPPIQQAFVC
jgi:hypothetical protein